MGAVSVWDQCNKNFTGKHKPDFYFELLNFDIVFNKKLIFLADMYAKGGGGAKGGRQKKI